MRWMAPLLVPLAAAAAFAVPCVLFARLILFHFYLRGAFLYDTGLLASVLWHSPASLPLPQSLGGESFFAFHVAPLLLLISTASRVLPLTMPQLFAAFVGVSHALLALGMFWLLVGGCGLRRGWRLALALIATEAFAFNGLALAIARYPHFETIGAAFLLLAFVALARERYGLAAASFVAALATREDMGLHAFGFLSLWILAEWRAGTSWRRLRWLAGFALAGAVASASALLAQHWAFPGHSSFMRVYVGDPPYAHLTWALIGERARGWLLLHEAVLLPLLGASVWAAFARTPWMLLGYAACLPWAVLQFTAASEPAGWMVGYYAFPFLLAMAWPPLALLIRDRWHGGAGGRAWTAAAGTLALAALSLLPVGRDYDPGRIPLPEAFLRSPPLARQAATDHAIAAIAAARPALGRLQVGNGVAALAPREFGRGEIAGWADGTPDTVAYFVDGFDARRLAPLPLPFRYDVPGTGLRLATDRPAEALRGLGIPLTPMPPAARPPPPAPPPAAAPAPP